MVIYIILQRDRKKIDGQQCEEEGTIHDDSKSNRAGNEKRQVGFQNSTLTRFCYHSFCYSTQRYPMHKNFKQ